MKDQSSHWNDLASALGAEFSVEPPMPAAPQTSEPPARPAPVREARPKPHPAAKSDWGKVAANLGLTPELAVEPAGDAGAFLDEVPDHDAPDADDAQDADDFAPRALAPNDSEIDVSDVRPVAESSDAGAIPHRAPRDESARDRERGRGRGRGRRGRHGREDSREVSRDDDRPRHERPAPAEDRDDQRYPAEIRSDVEGDTPRRDSDEPSRRVHPSGRDSDDDQSQPKSGEETSRRQRDNEGRSRRGRRRRRGRGGERTPDSPVRTARREDRSDLLADDDDLDAADPLAEFSDEPDALPTVSSRADRPPRDDQPHDDLHLSDVDDEDEEDAAAGLSHKNIPNWEEAIGIVIETNLAARSRSPQEPAGRGQGRPPRGGRGGRSGRGGRGGRRN